jgi:hypothetical protein
VNRAIPAGSVDSGTDGALLFAQAAPVAHPEMDFW